MVHLRGRGGGVCLALAIMASCMAVSPAFARGPEGVPGVKREAVAVSPPATVAETAVAAVDSVQRVLVVKASAAVVAIRRHSVEVERTDSLLIVTRLTSDPERLRVLHALFATSAESRPPNRLHRWRSSSDSASRVTAFARLSKRV